MNKQAAYKLARYAAERYAMGSPIQDDEDWLETIANEYRDFLDYLEDNDYEIIKKDESTIKTSVG